VLLKKNIANFVMRNDCTVYTNVESASCHNQVG